VYFIDSSTGYAVGWNGTILKTINAGTNWTKLSSGTSNNLMSVCFTDANTGYAVGASGTILKTVNGGTNWTLQTSGAIGDLLICFFKKTLRQASLQVTLAQY
jgi:photosystem II stability/assembly factor-like uncharacterized protein